MDLTKLYFHKWFPRFFYKKFDGGKESGVTGYFLIEWKKVFSIGILHFKKGSRESYHSHAFNAITWWLTGSVTEETYLEFSHRRPEKDFKPSFKPKLTKRNKIHKVISHADTYALTFRGPWNDTWNEFNDQKGKITLTHGRKIIDD